ncbi:HEAT repeat domain-containing protein [Nostoc sp. UCD121]|uniref:HEAT repeat domain-containing protein n=1 Tax=unclassified Nostoc TaxID=2593658 RepID=UPI00162A46F2|nr:MULTISPECIES: HEAT repeat domain-containing protein [unclassified Nostoc]MBC1222493.1 HEAT repeat domain-containing protein [Nostoc sp. UCD120]MBC1276454.1 HEAT repeat domain-containing protein [Nostoc sp. UCD121]MBC1295514.1 HEAT repeat domain-containing protein [Nostoc sp. UCD122]
MKKILQQVLIAHAKGEEEFAEKLGKPIREAGYEVAHRGTVMVGESFVEEASKALSSGSPVVLCGTIKALGTKWARQIVNAARNNYRVRIFCVQMDEEADVETVAFDECIAQYWQDPTKAQHDLITALKKYYPLQVPSDYVKGGNDAEQRYRELVLESCDIIDLANLPEFDRHIATQKLLLRQLYVALRVQVEIVSNAEVEEVELAAIEKRRIAMQRRRAGWSSEEKDEREDRGKRVPVGERLAKAKRLVVLGDPGAGKTTMIRWITTAYLLRLEKDPDWKDLPDVSTLPDEDWLPIIIRCRDLKNVSPIRSLDDILHYILRKDEMSEPECTALRGILIQKLKQGTALLLIDGLDEITDSLLRAEFCQQIEKICDAYKQAPIIVTSRIVGYREMKYRIGRQFEHVTVAELIKKDKDDFAHRWCDITELPERKKKAETELIQDIHSAERIERLTGNPMLLTTMALVKRKVGKLPTRRHKLYAQAVDVLLNWRSEVDKPIDDDEALPQLEYIAYAMCHRGVQQLRKDEVIELFEKFREEYPNLHEVKKHTPKEFLSLLEHRTGILVEAGVIPHNGRDIPVFEFRHLTFQEYLAGLALVQGHFPNRDRSLNLADYVAPLAAQINEVQSDHPVVFRSQQEVVVTENWREALRLCVASCNDDDVDDVLQAILKPIETEDAQITARPRAVLAALCLADEPNASEQMAMEILQEFVRNVGERDGNTPFSGTSVDTAAIELAESQWAEILCSILLQEFQRREAKVRGGCGGLLGMITTASMSNELETFHKCYLEQASRLKLSQEESIKAALIIEKILWKRIILFPVDQIFFDNMPEIIDTLLEMLTGSPPTSHAAAGVLRLFNVNFHPRIKRWQPSIKEKEQLISFISNLTSDTQALALICRILGNEREKQAVEPLIAKLNDADSNVRQAVASALEEIKDAQALKPLIAKLNDSDSDVRQAVASALGGIKNGRAVEPLIAKLNDADSDVQQAVASALGRIKNGRAVEPLIAKLNDSDSGVRQAVASALGEIKDARAVEPLIAKLNDANSDVRQTVARALGAIKNGRAIEPLIAKLNDSNNFVRQAVAGALGRIKNTRAVQPLIAKLNDADSDVQRAVASALGEIKDARAVEPLIAKLNHVDSDVQQAVAGALGKINDPRVLEPLIAKLNNADSEVQQAVEAALVQLGDTQTIQKLLNRLSSENQNTRVITLRALSWICQDKIDRELLSRDVDAFNPFLDPQEEINEERVNYAAAQLDISIEEVRMRYQKLAQQFGLRLNFTTDAS